MSTREYGYLYNEKATTTQIAAAIRSEIKTAKAEGLLPAGWRYSVRSRYFSGGSSIDITVKAGAEAWQECDGTVPGTRRQVSPTTWTAQSCGNVWCKAHGDPRYAHAAETHQVLTEEARAAEMTLRRIMDAYNHDGSDIQTDYFDVNFYGHVSFQRS